MNRPNIIPQMSHENPTSQPPVQERREVVKGVVLLAVGSRAFHIERSSDALCRAVPVAATEERREDVALLVIELVSCRLEPFHVFDGLTVALAHRVDLVNASRDVLLRGLRILRAWQAVEAR